MVNGERKLTKVSYNRIFLFVSILLHHVPYIKIIVVKYAQISTHVHLYVCVGGGGSYTVT